MALVDLKTKQSIVGLSSPISDMGTTIGDQFSHWRNDPYYTGPEPDQVPDLPVLDSLEEKLMTSPYSYTHGSPYGQSATLVYQGAHDLNGVLPSIGTYQSYGPVGGYY